MNKNSKNLMSIKENETEYDEDKKEEFILEKLCLFVNPKILNEEGKIYRMKKYGNINERKLGERHYSVIVNGEYLLKVMLSPKNIKITVKHE